MCVSAAASLRSAMLTMCPPCSIRLIGRTMSNPKTCKPVCSKISSMVCWTSSYQRWHPMSWLREKTTTRHWSSQSITVRMGSILLLLTIVFLRRTPRRRSREHLAWSNSCWLMACRLRLKVSSAWQTQTKSMMARSKKSKVLRKTSHRNAPSACLCHPIPLLCPAVTCASASNVVSRCKLRSRISAQYAE